MKQLTVRFANTKDLKWLAKKDDIKRRIIDRKIRQKEMVVAESQNKLIGFVRIEFLWSMIPYIGMIRVEKEYQKQGTGTSILGFVEKHLVKNGYRMMLSSSVENEKEPQEWHRKMGFKRCGYLDGIQKEGKEVFFRKDIA
jgi:ribosomal protein S18 acetylase RimI-like enzyme